MRKVMTILLSCISMLIGCQAIHAIPVTSTTKSVQGAPKLYVKTYGNLANPTIVFIHGGPGWNSFDFEYSTAPVLANEGFGVVVYDQLGSGRSPAGQVGDYTLTNATHELHAILGDLGVSHPILMGHSFGGTIGLSFLNNYPGFAAGLILVDSPVVWPDTMKQIVRECKARYQKYLVAAPETCTDSSSCRSKSWFQARIAEVTTLDNTMFPENARAKFDAENVASAFSEAEICGLYFPAQPTASAIAIFQRLQEEDKNALMGKNKADSTETGSPYLGFMRDVVTPAGVGYPYLDLTGIVRSHGREIQAIFGNEDGLFSQTDLNYIQSILPHGHFQVIPGASHAVYIWQQQKFIAAVKKAAASFAAP